MNKLNIKNRPFLFETIIGCLIIIFIVLIAGLRNVGFDRDSIQYYNIIINLDYSNPLSLIDKEPFFILIAIISKYIFFDQVRGVFFIFAFLGVIIKFYTIKKISEFPYLSLIIYMSLYFILHEMTQIRAGVAAGIFLLSLPNIVNRNYKNYFFKVLLATLFHYSSLVMVPLYCLNPKKINRLFYVFLPFLGILLAKINFIEYFFLKFLNIIPEGIGGKVKLYYQVLQYGDMSEINLLNIYYISLIAINIILVFNIYYISKYIIQVKLLSIMIFVFYSFSFFPILAFRISEFIGVVLIVLLPSMIRIFKQKIIVTSIIIFYSLGMLYNYLFIQKLLNI